MTDLLEMERLRVCVLCKLVPEPTTIDLIGVDRRVNRASAPQVLNRNDEYAIEAALRFRERLGNATSVEVILIAMAPPDAEPALRRGLAMGADRAVLVTDPALAGACLRTTSLVLAAAIRSEAPSLVVAGTDSSDGRSGTIGAMVGARLGWPFVSGASSIEGTNTQRLLVRRAGRRRTEIVDLPQPALVVVTQAVGEPRYPSLRATLTAARRPVALRSTTDIKCPVDPPTTEVVNVLDAPARPPATVLRLPPNAAALEILAFLGRRGLR